MPDADDTAKTILTLQLLGRDTVSPEEMINAFSQTNHFRTYSAERTPSFSANCNVLKALLYTSEPDKYEDYISKAAEFLCNTWFSGTIKDKWVRRAYSTSVMDS